jgi:hypothetical protein
MPSRTENPTELLGVYEDPPLNIYRTHYGVIMAKHENLIEGSHGHFGYPRFPEKRNVGGGFQLIGYHRLATAPFVRIEGRGSYRVAHYTGKFLMSIPWPSAMSAVYSPADWAAEAYSRMKPTAPEFSVLNSIYEMKDLPSLLQLRARNLKDLGKLHLNGQFGYLALLRDVRNLVQTQRLAQKRLAQLLRDNGRPVRRRVVLRAEEIDEGTVIGDLWGYHTPGNLVTAFFSHAPNQFTRRVYTDKIWASARFRYWLPGGPRDIAWRRRMLARLYGGMPTPSVLYNMIPWSWLVDWFTNLGSVIENLDAGVADRLAADYFYVMREVKRTHTSDRKVGFYEQDTGQKISVGGVAQGSSFSKVRIMGNPFGVGLNQEGLSPMQLSILGALGLSRL